MTALTWDKVGERRFQAGVDRGVLYLQDKTVPWNGLTGVAENTNREKTDYYQDGVKYMEHHVLDAFDGTLTAFTYPDEFAECIGQASKGNGLFFHEQRSKSFGLSYRTFLGDDIAGIEAAYEIHILYNLYAIPAALTRSTIGQTVEPLEFSWSISGTPEMVKTRRPTCHVSIRSTDLDFGLLEYLEEILYGSDAEPPYLPSLNELVEIIETPFSIVDNGNGTWTATGSDRSVVPLSSTAYQIKGAQVTQLDEQTFAIETSD